MKKCVIVYNEKSGKVKPSNLINSFYNIVEDYGYELEVHTTKSQGDATRIVKELPNDVDLLIAAGGDGTLNEVLRGNISRRKKLLMSIIPMGTTNDVGSMYGFSKNYEEDLKLILSGVEKNIDVVMVNKVPFIYVAAFGNFVNVTFDTPKKLKEIFGRFGYIMHGFTDITKKIMTHHIKFKLNDIKKEGDYSFIFVTNSNHVAGVNNIYKDIKLDDNKFEVLFCTLTNKADLLVMLMQIYMHGITEMKGCEIYQTSKLKIEFDEAPEFSWGIDGEEFKSDSKTFEFTINKSINMLLPPNNIDNLFDNKE